jgi:hypothetical protein
MHIFSDINILKNAKISKKFTQKMTKKCPFFGVRLSTIFQNKKIAQNRGVCGRQTVFIIIHYFPKKIGTFFRAKIAVLGVEVRSINDSKPPNDVYS